MDHVLRSGQTLESLVDAREAGEAHPVGAMHLDLATLLRKGLVDSFTGLDHITRRELDYHLLAVLGGHRLVAGAYERPVGRVLVAVIAHTALHG